MVSLPFKIRESSEGTNEENESKKTIESNETAEGTNSEPDEEFDRKLREFEERLVADEGETLDEKNCESLDEQTEEMEPEKQTLSDFEEQVLDAYEEFGVNREDVKEHWSESQIESIKEALGVSDKEGTENHKETHESENSDSEKYEAVSEYMETVGGNGEVSLLELLQGEESSHAELEEIDRDETEIDEKDETDESVSLTVALAPESGKELIRASRQGCWRQLLILRGSSNQHTIRRRRRAANPRMLMTRKCPANACIQLLQKIQTRTSSESMEQEPERISPEVVEESEREGSIELWFQRLGETGASRNRRN